MTNAQQPPTVQADQLIQQLAEKSGLDPKQAKKVITAFSDTIGENLAQGKRVRIHNLGTFEPKQRAERYATIPKNQQRITIPATTAPTFKPAEALRDKLKGTATAGQGAIGPPGILQRER